MAVDDSWSWDGADVRCVLVLASGAAWESSALDLVRETSGLVVLKRCVDVDDLMASAATQQADLAVVSADAPGLDGSAVRSLRRHGVGVVAVTAGVVREDQETRLRDAGVQVTVAQADLEKLPGTLLALGVQEPAPAPSAQLPGPRTVGGAGEYPSSGDEPALTAGKVVVVWGPVGAPGRTTVATAVAGELARRGRPTLLVDADPHASVGQHLGVLDQVSGLLAAARGGSTGLAQRLPTAARRIDEHLAVLTGLPRPERQHELREGVLAEVLGLASEAGDVVVDTGAVLTSAQTWRDGAPGLTLEALEVADEVVVVGAADPVGLARLARALVELREEWDDTPVRVVVNRMRPSLGWSRSDVAGMVEGFARVRTLHFLPEDRVAVDRALVAGRSVARESGSAVATGVRDLVDAVWPESSGAPEGARRPRLSLRRAGTTRQR